MMRGTRPGGAGVLAGAWGQHARCIRETRRLRLAEVGLYHTTATAYA